MGNENSKPDNKLKRFTKFEHENIDKWSDDFYNVYPNECFTLKDLIRELRVYFPDTEVEPFSKHLFRAFSMNNEIGFHDFIKIYSYLIHGEKNQKLWLIFKLYDANNDDKLSKEDILTVFDDLTLMLKDVYTPNFNINGVIKEIFSQVKEKGIDFKRFRELESKNNKAFKMLFCVFDNKNIEE
ncbi:recoverin-like calcium-binding protein [Tubulinosema ratisbonensis]|uniref:Recoverin-like calcium-binding protein n=1 Tax=Tubulinosema ratisbonensis TaxID=291195 RepID=A0A437AKX3_9MICR|nr:recoverin-like calcium-binding protein [Tubulinosema ratisbonensis]